MEFRIVDRNGCTKWVDNLCIPVRGDDGVYLGGRASNRDITERKHAEAAVDQGASFYFTLEEIR